MISWRIGSAENRLAFLACVAVVAVGARSSQVLGNAQDAADGEIAGPRPAPVDAFHPERERAAIPAFGGTVTVHLESLPRSLNNVLENSSTTRNMLNELHEYLVRQDWEMWDARPGLATRWDVEDTLILKGGRGPDDSNILFGRVDDDGEHWLVTPVSAENPLGEPRKVAKADVESVERGTVQTFHLREGVRWHDGEAFDAEDVLFTWRAYNDPLVRCDSSRAHYQRIVRAEALDPLTVRFFQREQHFRSLTALIDFCILPRHLYDLTDPAHPRHDANASPEARAREINENVHNTRWVGLGPYRVTSFGQQGVEAERFDDYFDPEHGGFIDRIRWRHISGDAAAFQALINGELDFTVRISSDQYFGEATSSAEFSEHFYKGYFYVPLFNYTPWNMRRPLLQDVRVRKALAHAVDSQRYLDTLGHGLGKLVTGDQFYFGPAYDHDVKRLEFDLDRAAGLFAEAGWYDRDGDGLIDKDGIPFEFEMLVTPPGNKAAETFAQMVQEDLAKIGVRMNITALEFASYLERLYDRDFDAGGGSWSMPIPENDPVQLWHSSGAPVGVRGSNHPGVADPKVDELIARGGRELDDEKRWAIWRELQRYLYEEVQPYLLRDMTPRKFAMNKTIRGMQTFSVFPGYSIRRWYYPAGTPGTRATRAK